jgi:hypothetical protein
MRLEETFRSHKGLGMMGHLRTCRETLLVQLPKLNVMGSIPIARSRSLRQGAQE